MKAFFEDHGEVEHVVCLTQNPGFTATLANLLRDHAIAAGVPAHRLDGDPPTYEPGCDADGYPLDPAHPWNGGLGCVDCLNSRQQAIVDALEAAIAGRDMSAPLWELLAVEADTAAAALVPAAEHGKRFTGRKHGAKGVIGKQIAAYLKEHPTAKANEVWAALAANPPAGCRFMDSRSLGRYIEAGAKEVMRWQRFERAVSEARPSEAKRPYKKRAR